MTALEDQLRSTLRDLAQESRAVPLLARLERDARTAHRRRRLVPVAVAAVTAGVVAAGALVAHLLPDPSIVQPSRAPARMITLSEAETLSPGRAEMLLTLAARDGARASYVVPVGGSTAIRLQMTPWVPATWAQHVSYDGTRVVRQNDSAGDPRLEIVDLRTGSTDSLDEQRGYCPWLAPGNDTVAFWELVRDDMTLLDARTYGKRAFRDGLAQDAACTSHGWSVDGDLLVVGDRDGSSVLDRRGRQVHMLPGRVTVNGSQSWSADSRLLLLYEAATGRYLVHDVTDGSESELNLPAAALRPLGWAGSRIVWLVGEAGTQSLVTTHRDGGDRRLWTTLDVGDVLVDTVTWSRDLGGTPRD